MRGLRDRVAVVTGSTRGIGAATARRLGEEGCKVVVTGRDAGLGQAVVDSITEKGGTAAWIPANLSDEAQVKGLMDQTVELYGSLRILVNNAAPIDLMSTGSDGPCHTQTTENIEKLFAVGVYGTFWCCKYALPHMMKEESGSIVNMSTVASVRAHPAFSTYSMMKGAVNSLTMNLAVDYGPNIRANAIIVGATSGTGSVDFILEKLGDSYSGANVTRLGNAEDMAASAAFLASDDSAVTTGSLIYCEGGEAIKMDVPNLEELLNAGVPSYQ